jgi:Na+/H+-dicarboxylate symporter
VNVIGNCLATVVIARWEGEFPPPSGSAAASAAATMPLAAEPEG